MNNEKQPSKITTILLYTIAILMFVIPISYFTYTKFFANNTNKKETSILTITNQSSSLATTNSSTTSSYISTSSSTILSSSSSSNSESSLITIPKEQTATEETNSNKQEQQTPPVAPPAPPQPKGQEYSYISYDCSTSNALVMLNLINEHRSNNGSAPLSLDSSLNGVACAHSTWMSQTDSLSHEGFDGTSPFERCQLANTECFAENVADNSDFTATNLFEQFKNSPVHNTNMINPNYSYVGFGFDGIYVTQLFR
jgi:uncharacterized protein YkwD